jgi:hypothetical protein
MNIGFVLWQYILLILAIGIVPITPFSLHFSLLLPKIVKILQYKYEVA